MNDLFIITIMIIDDYLEYSNKYKNKYGDKCIVLMQVGSFYELYSIDDDTSSDIYNIADICNIQISRKNKSITEVSISNPLMAGFPLYTLKKYTNILLNNNYTIVLIEQITEPPNPERKLTEILSPGMNINIENKKTNFMMVLYFEYIDNRPVAGMAGIDLSTGKSFVYEAGSTKLDPEFTNDEIYRIMTTYNPQEVIVLSDKKYEDAKKAYLMKNINRSNILIHYLWNNFEYITHMNKISYQNTILTTAFRKKNMLSIIEMLNLDKYQFARIALCCLLQFAYEHNVDIVKNLSIPEIINDNKFLNIEYNSAIQLNILSSNANEKPLIDILNRCCTPFGSRAFKEKLLNPIIDCDKLNKSYDDIDFVLQNNKYVDIMKNLRGILDIERIQRKMSLNKFNPLDWVGFNISLINAFHIMKTYYDYNITKYEKIINYYNTVIDLDEASKYNLCDIKGNFFIKGVYKDVDDLVEQFNNAFNEITNVCQKINNIGEGDTTSCKIDYGDKDGYYISITKKRFETAKAKDSKYMKDFQVKSLATSNNVKIVNKEIVMASNTMENKQNEIVKKVLVYYREFVSEFIEKFESELREIVDIICNIDISCCNARNAREYRYYRPILKDNDASYVKAKYMRHPIIERIDESTEYIGNDIEINKTGMLLYGINAAGKSSLMKSVGINIVMAQAGMFVACEEMEYHPYKHIFTRISGMDNIYKGMSSFTVEMTELRNILQRCDKYSLVLGDEICSGTESISALAIVASGIDMLVKNNVGFIFATHLHDLTEIGVVKKHIGEYITVKHIHIIIEDNKIIYERKLKDGKGLNTYGIEVCKSLDMPGDFMMLAESIRKEVCGLSLLMVEPVNSKYNNEVFMTKCHVCGEKAVDTHHINYQSLSDENGNFKNFHQNIKHNLMPLCKACHKKHHSGEIDIKGYIQTSEGIEVQVNLTPEYKNNNMINEDITDDDFENIKQYIKKGKQNWYMRKSKTGIFKECSNNNKIIEKIKTITGKNIIIDDEHIMKLYDPRY